MFTRPLAATVVILILTVLAAIPAGWLADRAIRPYAASKGAPRQLAVTVGMALIFAWAAVTAQPNLVLAASLALGWTLVCLAVIDLSCFRLPDAFTLPLLAAGLGVAVFLPGRPILNHLVGAAAGWGALALAAFAYRLWRGVDGIGLGDAKLLGAAGAWLGWRPLPSVVLIACAMAFLWVGVQAIARGRAALTDRLAFGAPLCLAIWIVWLHGPLAI